MLESTYPSNFNTLAQNGTGIEGKGAFVFQGKGSDLGNEKAMKGRAKRKMITTKMSLCLVDIARENRQFDWEKKYWNTYHCQNKVYTAEGRLYGRYCKNRFCLLCCSIRKADIMNRYLPFLSKCQDLYFVTLTAKSVPLQSLRKRMLSMINGFGIILAKHKKRAQRGKGIKPVGIRSLECNYNPVLKIYNPHLDIIVASKEMAEMIRREWLAMSPRHLVSPAAQKVDKVWNNETALMEVVKYGSKIFTEPDVNNKASKKGESDIYAAALNNIFASMKGLRIFERFGFNLPKSSKETLSKVVSDYYQWTFEPCVFDWINPDIDAVLSGYMPSDSLVNLLEYNINKKAE